MDLTFMPNQSTGLPQKRSQSFRACSTCRHQKKRCRHIHGSTGSQLPTEQRSRGSTEGADEVLSSGSTGAARSSKRFRSNTQPAKGSQGKDAVQFLGDLSAEVDFLASSRNPGNDHLGASNGVGIWIEGRRKDHESEVKRHIDGDFANPIPDMLLRLDPNLSRFFARIRAKCSALLPDETDLKALEKIYWTEVQPLLPVIEGEHYRKSQGPIRVALQQVISLAACSSAKARPHLRLPNFKKPGMQVKKFIGLLAAPVITALKLGFIHDLEMSIRIRVLLSIFLQLTPDRGLCSDLCARAVTDAQTMGLHLESQNHDAPETHSPLFACLWTVDRLNAALQGRPVLIHERDIGRKMDAYISTQYPPFQTLLRVVRLLDQVIDLYRPSATCEVAFESSFPAFEQLLVESASTRTSSHFLVTIELLYHAVSILAYRPRNARETLVSKPAYIRQMRSAERITMTAGDELVTAAPILPIIPYAISLSLKVAYRELRFTKVPFHQARARKQLLMNCDLLRRLGSTYEAAESLAIMAEQVMRQYEKTVTQLVSATNSNFTAASNLQGRDRYRLLSHDTQGQDDSVEARAVSRSDLVRSNLQRDGAHAARMSDESSGNDTFDLTVFESLPDWDVFQHFDPAFNLSTVDTVFGDGAQFPEQLEAPNYAE